MFPPRLSVSLLAILAFAGASPASPTTLPAQIIGPDRVLRIQPEAQVHAMAVSPDGRTAYALMTARDIELTALAVRFWPELLAAIACLWTARRVLGVLRRPQDAGAPHCRKCNYILTGLSSQRCPECGTVLTARTRVRGRSTWRRLVVPAGLFAVAAGMYLGANHRAPRCPAIPQSLQCRAVWPATWAMDRNVRWLRPYIEERDLLAAVDLQRGGIRRVLCNWPKSQRHPRGEIVLLSGDGRNIIVTGPRASNAEPAAAFHHVDVEAGRVARQYNRNQQQSVWPSVGLLDDSLFTAKYAREDQAVVASWRLSTGQKIGEFPLPPLPDGCTRASLQLVSSEKHLLALEYVSGKAPFHMRVHVIQPQPPAIVRSFSVDGINVYYACRDRCSSHVPSTGLAVLTMPGGRMDHRETGIWDTRTGQRTQIIGSPPPEFAPPVSLAQQARETGFARIDITPDGRLLLGSVVRQARRMAVYDLAAERWLGVMDTTGVDFDRVNPVLSPDSRLYVAARRAAGRPVGSHELAVYDLTRWRIPPAQAHN